MLNRLPIPLLAVCVLWIGPRSAVSQDSSADVPNCPATRDPAERLWCQGGAKWESRDYNGAIPYLTQALDLYKKHPTLSRTTWRILVDNLGMAHGMAGDLGKAKEIFEYGLSVDSTYPMFYYLMADDYAEAGHEALTIEYLKRAYAHRAHGIPGEPLPDPSTDDSFQRFMHDQKFLTALKEWTVVKTP